MSTSLVVALLMPHSNEEGVVVPARIAPPQIMIIPVTPKEETRAQVWEACENLAQELRGMRYEGALLEVEVDRRDFGGGAKNWEWIKKGVPVRVEIGPRDLEKNSVAVSRRDEAVKKK